MEAPKDVPIKKQVIESCEVFLSDTFQNFPLPNDILIFVAWNVIIEQRKMESYVDPITFLKRNYAPETILTFIGQMPLGLKIPQSYLLNRVSFAIKLKRTDVIEVLKFGSYISIKGVGLGTELTNVINESSVHQEFKVRVIGELNIM